MRRIVYLTGTRADYGLMRRTLHAISAHPALDLAVIVTGMHLDLQHGETVREIEADGFRISARIPVDFTNGKGFMARGIASVIRGVCDVLEAERPDMLLLLGDRGEMLAGAIAAIHLNIPVAHIHGGERSGTVDEPVRHAISKLAHIHLTATPDAAQRLIRMGERPAHVHCVGAPGLVGLAEEVVFSRAELMKRSDLAGFECFALLVFHPVVQEADDGPAQIAAIVSALRSAGYAIVGLRPNADFGGEAIRAALDAEAAATDLRLYTHLTRSEFVSWMAHADVMIGNSSSGIIEAASFGTPVINVGTRQHLRERNHNVVDVRPEPEDLSLALAAVRTNGRLIPANVYGDGQSDKRISELLSQIPISGALLDKACVY